MSSLCDGGGESGGGLIGRPATVVIGLGNPLRGDDGIGIVLVAELAAALAGRADLECADAGASGMQVVHLIAGRRKAVLLDCARMGAPPGAIRCFTPGDARAQHMLARLSLHEGDLLQMLELSRRLGEAPGEIVIFGIEPADLSPSPALSPLLAARVPAYLRRIAAELDAPA